MEILTLTLLRLVVPLFILKWPLVGIVAALWIDASDWHWYPFRTSQDYIQYQVWDKVLDTYYLSIAFFTSLFWEDLKARGISVLLFIYRTIGFVLFTFTQNNLFLFLFPNIFENFFIFYLLYVFITKNSQLFLPSEKGIILLTAIAVPKIFQEYLLHFADITAAELFGFTNEQSFWALFSTIVFVYLMILWWRIELQKEEKISIAQRA